MNRLLLHVYPTFAVGGAQMGNIAPRQQDLAAIRRLQPSRGCLDGLGCEWSSKSFAVVGQQRVDALLGGTASDAGAAQRRKAAERHILVLVRCRVVEQASGAVAPDGAGEGDARPAQVAAD